MRVIMRRLRTVPVSDRPLIQVVRDNDYLIDNIRFGMLSQTNGRGQEKSDRADAIRFQFLESRIKNRAL